MKKLAIAALAGVQMIALAAAVQAAGPDGDDWSEWRETTMTELKAEAIDNQIIENIKVQLNDLEIITKEVKPENGEGESTFEFTFNDLSENGPKVEIPEGATYEEFQDLLVAAYPELEGQFDKITELKEQQEQANKDFEKEFEDFVNDSMAPERPEVVIPEDASIEEVMEILAENDPFMAEKLEEHKKFLEEMEKSREEFNAEFEKQWEEAIPEISEGEEMIPDDATFEEARDIFLKEHPELADEFKDWGKKPEMEKPEMEKPVQEKPEVTKP